MKETDIQKAICDYLAYKHYFFWRQNTIPIFADNRFRAMPKYSMNGVPDIILIHNGGFVGIEVKMPKGVLSENQRTFSVKCQQAGGRYLIARSLDDVIKIGL